MLSRNNYQEKIRRVASRQAHFSIRKLSIGTASVLIGFTLFAFNSQGVQADSTGVNNQLEQDQEKSDTEDTSASNVLVDPKAEQNTNEAEDVSSTNEESEGNKKQPLLAKETDSTHENESSEHGKKDPVLAQRPTGSRQENNGQPEQKVSLPSSDKNGNLQQPENKATSPVKDAASKTKQEQTKVPSKNSNEQILDVSKLPHGYLPGLNNQLWAMPGGSSMPATNIGDWQITYSTVAGRRIATITGLKVSPVSNAARQGYVVIPNPNDFSNVDEVDIPTSVLHTLADNEKAIGFSRTGHGKVMATPDQIFRTDGGGHADWSGSPVMTWNPAVSPSVDDGYASSDDGAAVSIHVEFHEPGWGYDRMASFHQGIFSGDEGDLSDTAYNNAPKDAPSASDRLQYLDVRGLEISKLVDAQGNTPLRFMFANQSNLKAVEGLNYLDTSKVTDMSDWFWGDISLNNLNGIGQMNTSKVKSMAGMFEFCKSLENPAARDAIPAVSSLAPTLTTPADSGEAAQAAQSAVPVAHPLNLSGWNTSNVTTMAHMFANCTKLQSLAFISNWNNGSSNTRKLVNMSDMCQGMRSLRTLAGIKDLDTSNVLSMYEVFQGLCDRPTPSYLQQASIWKVDTSSWNWDTSKVRYMNSMFAANWQLRHINLSKFDTSSLYNMYALVADDHFLKDVSGINNWDTSHVHLMESVFANDFRLRTVGDLSNWQTSNVEAMAHLFRRDISLQHVGNISNWDVQRVGAYYPSGAEPTGFDEMFLGNQKLTSAEIGDLSVWTNTLGASMEDTFTGSGLTDIKLGRWVLPADIGDSGDLTTWNSDGSMNFDQKFSAFDHMGYDPVHPNIDKPVTVEIDHATWASVVNPSTVKFDEAKAPNGAYVLIIHLDSGTPLGNSNIVGSINHRANVLEVRKASEDSAGTINLDRTATGFIGLSNANGAPFLYKSRSDYDSKVTAALQEADPGLTANAPYWGWPKSPASHLLPASETGESSSSPDSLAKRISGIWLELTMVTPTPPTTPPTSPTSPHHSAVPEPVAPGEPAGTSAVGTGQGGTGTAEGILNLRLTHNAFISTTDYLVVQRHGKTIVLPRGLIIHPMNHGLITIIHGKKFYQLRINGYVKVSNTEIYKFRLFKLTHNAFVYNINGKALHMKHHKKRHLVLPKGMHVNAWNNGNGILINGKVFYQIGKNRYIKAFNTVPQDPSDYTEERA